MDTLKEFFAATRERLSSPFFGSFIFAWCVANWKIFIALAFFSDEDYCEEGSNNAVGYIVKYLKSENNYVWPILIAIAYTFGYPFFKAAIRAARDFADVLSEKWNLKIAGTSKVDTLKYLEIKESLSIKEKKLQALIDEETEFRKAANLNSVQLESVEAALIKANDELNSTKELLNEHEHYDPFNQLLGVWEVRPNESLNDISLRMFWIFNKQNGYFVSFGSDILKTPFVIYKPNFIVGKYRQDVIALRLSSRSAEGLSMPPEGLTVYHEISVFLKKTAPSEYTVFTSGYDTIFKMQKHSE